MTFDEFLLSEKISCSFGDKDILKIPYNENIYFIYKPTYNRLEYNEKLENIGVFEKQNQKLYGSSWEFDTRYNKELESKFYKGSFEKINEELSRVSKHQAGEYWALKNALIIREQINCSFVLCCTTLALTHCKKKIFEDKLFEITKV